ncbi:MAG: dihydropteroate synthase [Phycisphaerae bacterium]|nr:dihydropteroate synthase [Phycisphaerae bacterium]
MKHWRLANSRALTLDRPRLLGILNVTHDSFSDGGLYTDPGAACAAAERMVDEGADAIDIGGESTRPGASRISAAEQCRRVIPVIRSIRALAGPAADIPISIDTTLAAVARAALDAGADAVNDVSGGTEDSALVELVARTGAGLILMHRERPPESDTYSDRYAEALVEGDIVAHVIASLRDHLVPLATRAGVATEHMMIDPGLGFGKTVSQNVELIARSAEIADAVDLPLVSGLSRKSFVGRIGLKRDSEPGERLPSTLTLSLAHRASGASVFRVHDVAAHAQAFAAAERIAAFRSGAS